MNTTKIDILQNNNMQNPSEVYAASEGFFLLYGQNTHILFGLGGEGGGLGVVSPVARLHPGEKVVANYVPGVMGQLGAGAFHMREVIPDVIVELLEGLWKAFVECVMNLGVVIIDRKMAEQVVLEVINRVKPHEVDPDGMMEILKVNPETQVSGIDNIRNHIGLTGGKIFVQAGRTVARKLCSERFNRCQIAFFTFYELGVIGAKQIGQIGDHTFARHQIHNSFYRFHKNQSFFNEIQPWPQLHRIATKEFATSSVRTTITHGPCHILSKAGGI